MNWQRIVAAWRLMRSEVFVLVTVRVVPPHNAEEHDTVAWESLQMSVISQMTGQPCCMRAFDQQLVTMGLMRVEEPPA